jgi:hypothetical protein
MARTSDKKGLLHERPCSFVVAISPATEALYAHIGGMTVQILPSLSIMDD